MNKEQEEFRKLPKRVQRVEIAKDVIKWVNLGKLKPSTGSYVQSCASDFRRKVRGLLRIPNGDFIPSETQLDPKDAIENCNGVCGIGALFLISVDRRNDYPLLGEMLNCGLDERDTKNHLADLFEDRQMDLIEIAFERAWRPNLCRYYRDSGDGLSRGVQAALEFGRSHEDDSPGRMVAIMKDIVDHDGTFLGNLENLDEEDEDAAENDLSSGE